jgi:hypothetical protein
MGVGRSRPSGVSRTRRAHPIRGFRSVGKATRSRLKVLSFQNNRPVLRKTLEQGDCLYSAIYRACAEQNLLNKFKGHNINTSTEDNFVVSMRNLVANNIQSDVENMFKEAYIQQKAVETKENANTLRLMREGLPKFASTLIERYVKLKKEPTPVILDKYVNDYLNKVRTREVFSGETEVNCIKNFITSLGITLDIRIYGSERKNDPIAFKHNKIYIMNINEGHYEFFSFDPNSRYPVSDMPMNSRSNSTSRSKSKGFQPLTRSRTRKTSSSSA